MDHNHWRWRAQRSVTKTKIHFQNSFWLLKCLACSSALLHPPTWIRKEREPRQHWWTQVPDNADGVLDVWCASALTRRSSIGDHFRQKRCCRAFTRCSMNVAQYLHYLAAGHVNFFPSGVEHTWADFLKLLFLISRKAYALNHHCWRKVRSLKILQDEHCACKSVYGVNFSQCWTEQNAEGLQVLIRLWGQQYEAQSLFNTSHGFSRKSFEKLEIRN